MTQSSPQNKLLPVFLISLPLLFIARVFLLERVGLLEYDSVHNFIITRELAGGDFTHIFQHSSPLFFLLNLPVYKLFDHFLALEYFTALLSVLAVSSFVRTVNRYVEFSWLENLLLTLYTGTSVFLVYNARSFAMDSVSLLLFLLILDEWLQSLDHRQDLDRARRYWQRMWFWIAVLLTINYKVIVLFPVLVLIEWIQPHRCFPARDWLRSIGVIIGFMAILILMGMMLGNKWWEYPAQWYVLLFRKMLNPTAKVSTFHWDVDFYFRYFIHFESPLLLPGLVALVYRQRSRLATHARQLISSRRVSLNFEEICLLICLCVLAGMSILPKAPRGILFIYPLLYFLSFLGIKTLLNHRAVLTVLFAALIVFNMVKVNSNVYRYAQTNYPRIAEYLGQQKVNKLATTVGINIVPFLPAHTIVTGVFFEQELQKLKDEGYKYCLVDDYHYVVGAHTFDSIRRIEPLLALKEPTLQSPLLYLEHSEFTGLTFEQMLSLREKTVRDQYQLRLVKLE